MELRFYELTSRQLDSLYLVSVLRFSLFRLSTSALASPLCWNPRSILQKESDGTLIIAEKRARVAN